MTLVFLLLGLITLVVGAEVLVRGASSLARAIGLPPMIIGLTVVAYGTSAPEFAVIIKAGWMNQADLALGNVVGSNTFNVLFILGGMYPFSSTHPPGLREGRKFGSGLCVSIEITTTKHRSVSGDPHARARQLQAMLDAREVKNRAELARRLGLSRARITQILK